MTDQEAQKLLITFIDRGSWKHSWHLHKDRYGEINWEDKSNLQKLHTLVLEAHQEARELKEQACQASHALNYLVAKYSLKGESQ